MIKENYTGDSNIIKRIVAILNKKAPLPLDQQGDVDWGTDGKVLGTDGVGGTKWVDPGSGGGDVTDVEVNGTSVVNAQGVAEVSVPTKTSDLTNDSDFVDGTDLSTALSAYTPTSGLSAVATSGDYDDLSNKPSIPTKTSDLTNDSGFITNLVNDLANYYTKSQTYTQAEVDALISGIVTLNILVVQTLPTQDISTTTIYLVPKQDTGTSDIYDEYLYINNAWELIGTTQIDLSNYVTTTDLSTALADYVTSVGLATILADYAQISDLPTVNDGTLTIQQNGTTVGSFSANQSGDVTVNLTGGGGSGGHTIEDTSGADLPQEDNLQFVGVYTRDDSVNSRTEVNIVRQMTKAAMDALPAAQKAGFIRTSDEPDNPYVSIDASQVHRGASDVDADLTALENGKVNRSGDTMTGRLNIASVGSNDWYPLTLKSNFTNACYMRLYDKNGAELGAFGCNEANVPYFRDGNGVLHVLSMRKVTTLVNETANIAAGGNKTYATLTPTALSAYDEICLYAEYGNVASNGSATKAQIAAAASYGGGATARISFLGYVLETNGTISTTHSFGIRPRSTGLQVLNLSVNSTIGRLLIEGITY